MMLFNREVTYIFIHFTNVYRVLNEKDTTEMPAPTFKLQRILEGEAGRSHGQENI